MPEMCWKYRKMAGETQKWSANYAAEVKTEPQVGFTCTCNLHTEITLIDLYPVHEMTIKDLIHEMLNSAR